MFVSAFRVSSMMSVNILFLYLFSLIEWRKWGRIYFNRKSIFPVFLLCVMFKWSR